jgi:hypothetical protein
MEAHMKLTIPGILITALIVASPTAFAQGGMNFSGTSSNSAKWCAVNPWGDGDVDWDCKYRSIEECRPVIAGNRGFCSPSPSHVANPPELRNSRQASPMGSKTIAKSEKAIAVKKESPRHRNANARTKIVASPITVKTPRQHGKSNAESKNSIATKIESPQPAQSDGKSNAESKNSIATKVESPQPAQSDDKSNAESKNSIATKIESPQPAQSDDETVIKKAKITVAAKMEDPASVEFVDIKRAMNKNTYEIICGYVKGKKKSGEATGERPFLYLVKENEAYIVDRGPESMAAIVYRAQCTSASSR